MTHRKRWLITTGALGFLAAMLFGGATTAAAAEGPVILPPTFAPDPGDGCPMGYTKGTLSWLLGPNPAVGVDGVALDRPLTDEIIVGCGEDRRFTVVTFTAYSRTGAREGAVVRVDNGMRDFTFTLSPAGGAAVLTVQVCRHSVLTGKLEYCGELKKYLPAGA